MSATLICSKDREALTKASHTAGFLVEELRALNRAENPLLAEMSADILAEAASLRQRLERLMVITGGLD
jgi:hypothetical protein